ncbi:MAG: hypothetical protein U1D30_24095, partial [Planctomycetota bacterium]
MDSAKPMEADDNEPPRRRRLRGSRALGLLGVLPLSFAGIALLAPLADVDVSERIGLLLVISAALEIAHGYRRTTDEGQRAAWYSGGINLAMGIVLINAPFLATTALLLFLGGSLALDGV